MNETLDTLFSRTKRNLPMPSFWERTMYLFGGVPIFPTEFSRGEFPKTYVVYVALVPFSQRNIFYSPLALCE